MSPSGVRERRFEPITPVGGTGGGGTVAPAAGLNHPPSELGEPPPLSDCC